MVLTYYVSPKNKAGVDLLEKDLQIGYSFGNWSFLLSPEKPEYFTLDAFKSLLLNPDVFFYRLNSYSPNHIKKNVDVQDLVKRIDNAAKEDQSANELVRGQGVVGNCYACIGLFEDAEFKLLIGNSSPEHKFLLNTNAPYYYDLLSFFGFLKNPNLEFHVATECDNSLVYYDVKKEELKDMIAYAKDKPSRKNDVSEKYFYSIQRDADICFLERPRRKYEFCRI